MTDAPGIEYSSPPARGGLVPFLEQFDATRPLLDAGDCPNTHVPYLMGVNPRTGKALIFRPRCKMWTCPVCGPANAWVWAFRIHDGAMSLYDQGHKLDFVTITSSSKLSPGQSWWVAPRAWSKLQARVRRAAGPYQYARVPEVQPGTRRVHFHLVTTAHLAQQWWEDNGAECGFGWKNDTREVWQLGGVTSYAVKYLTKALDEHVPAHTRRVNTSRAWPKSPPKEPPEGWYFLPVPRGEPLQAILKKLAAHGYEYTIRGSKSAWGVVNGDV